MPPTEHALSIEELAAAAASCFDDEGIAFFIEACVTEQMKQTVENNGDVLADTDHRKTVSKGFSAEEIELMKSYKLSQMEYEEYPTDPGEFSKFKLKLGNSGAFILFSNRESTRGEQRGGVLKQGLDELKKENQETSLYDALTKLIRSPKTMALGIYPSIFSDYFTPGKSEIFAQDMEYSNKKDIIIESLTELSTACIKYIEEERSKKIPDAQSIRAIKEIIATKKQEIFLLTFNKPTPTSDSFLEFIKAKARARETEIKNVNTWVKSLTDLADNQSKKDEQKIYALTNFATALLAWQNFENRDPAIGKELAKKFTESVEEARKLYKKSVWKKVLHGETPLETKMTERLSKMPGILTRIAKEIQNQPLPPEQSLRPTASP